eukprot:992558_1
MAQRQDEKEQKAEMKVKDITQGSTWEDLVNNALQFINSDSIHNMAQLIDIVPVRNPGGSILIYYWSKPPERAMMNSPNLRCTTHRRNSHTHKTSAECLSNLVATHTAQQTLFKIGHNTQANNHPITFVWFWTIKPILSGSLINRVYNEVDHMLRNRGHNVATIERACSVRKPAVYPVNIFQSGYDVNKYTYVLSTQILQIDFDRAYILNTLKFWLYDGDTRVYKYKVEISKDEQVWTRIANYENKVSWQKIQFDAQFVQHVRFIEGSSSTSQDLPICKFYAFFDYGLQQ